MARIAYKQPKITYEDAEVDTDTIIDQLVKDRQIDADEEHAARTVVITEIDAYDCDRDVAITYRMGDDEDRMAYVHSEEYDANNYLHGVQFDVDEDSFGLARFFQEIGLQVGI